eukprot:TRINITY_DN3790_c0_g1_i5.p1 TRINITY_DN3790_c0_g1~~TRINITY_DN3790_c0_g1_i5.p1  ORF type:complete len:781 (+),score=175.23 TRINITY_DN3790_c0_g1_i5:65-2407(+)
MKRNPTLEVGGEEYDYNKWCHLIANEQMTATSDCGGVLFVGATGSGKSTAIALQLGAVYEWIEGQYKLMYSPTGTPQTQTSSASIPQTLHISAWKGPGGRTWIDSAGLGENRGKDEKCWTEANLHVFLRTVGSLDAIVVALDYGQLATGKTSMEQLSPLLSVPGDDDWLMESLVFYVIGASTEGEQLSVDEVKEKYDSCAKDNETLLKNYEADLLKNHLDDGKIPSDEREKVEERRLLIRLMKRLSSKGSQVVVSNIRGEEACEGTKARLEAAVAAVGTLQGSQLKDLGMGELGGARGACPLFAQMLRALCQRELPLLTKKKNLLCQLRKDLEDKEPVLCAIERDHETARRLLVQEAEDTKTGLHREITTANATIDKLQQNTQHVEFKREELSCQKPSSLFGILPAMMQYQYDDTSAPFDSYELLGSSVDRDASRVIKCHPSAGCLTMHIVAKRECAALDATIVLKREERHLSPIKDQVASLRTKVRELEGKLKTALLSLATAHTAEAVKQVVVGNLRSMQKELNEVEGIFKDSLPTTSLHGASPITVSQYVAQLARLLRLLKSKGLLPAYADTEKHIGWLSRICASLARDPIEDFLAAFGSIETHTKSGGVIERFAPSVVAGVQDKASFNEMQQAVLRPHEDVINVVADTVTAVWRSVGGLPINDQVSVGMVVVVAMLLIDSWVWWRAASFAVACVVVLAAVRVAWVAAVERVQRDTRKGLDEVLAQVVASRADASEVLLEVSEKFAAKFNLDLQANLDPARGSFAHVPVNVNVKGSLF